MFIGSSSTGGRISSARGQRKSRTDIYGPDSEPTYGDEAKIEIKGLFLSKYRCEQPLTTIFVYLNPTRVEENNVKVVKLELRTRFHIKALSTHRGISTRARLDADNSTYLNYVESVARHWLKDCLESYEVCVEQHNQS